MRRERIEAFKNHIQVHKDAYIAAGVGLVVGIAVGAVTVWVIKNGGPGVIVDSFKLQWKSPTTNIVQTMLERRGHPGNIILCDQSGEVFASQNRAAQAMGINPGNLAQHLKGKFDQVGGFTFTNLGEAV